MTSRAMHWLRRAAAPLALAAATAYLVWSIGRGDESLLDAVADSDPWWWAASVLVFVPMFLLQARYHATTLAAMAPAGAGAAPLADMAAYLQSQVVRYLPGKIWGLLYQMERMKGRHSAARVLGANLWQLVATNLLSIGIAAALVAYGLRLLPPVAALAIAVASIGLTELLHRTRLVAAAQRWLEQRSAWLRARGLPTPPRGMGTRGSALLVVEWLFFAAGLWLLLAGRVEPGAAIAAIGWYAGSSAAAILAIAVPAGIAVREAMFIGGHGLLEASSASLLVVATQARLAMVAAEILACAIATLAARGGIDANA